jgi:hypothetical protein
VLTRFALFFSQPSQIDKVKITPRDGISYEVENKIGSFATLDRVQAQEQTRSCSATSHLARTKVARPRHSIRGLESLARMSGQSSYFSVLGSADERHGPVPRHHRSTSLAAGVFERFNTSGIDAIGTLALSRCMARRREIQSRVTLNFSMIEKKKQTKNNSKKSTKKISLIVCITSSEILLTVEVSTHFSDEHCSRPRRLEVARRRPMARRNVPIWTNCLAQAELINDDDLVASSCVQKR